MTVPGSAWELGGRNDRRRLGRGNGTFARSALPGVGQNEILLDVHVADRDVRGLEDLVVQAGDDAVLAGWKGELVAAGSPGLSRSNLAGLRLTASI